MIVLKIILWIILALLLLIVVALCLPVRFCVKYNDSFALTLKYLFISIPLVPRESKKRTKKKKITDKEVSQKKVEDKTTSAKKQEVPKNKKSSKENKKKQEEEKPSLLKQIKDLHKQKGLDGIITVIKELSNILTGTLKNIFKRIKLRKFDLNISVSQDNAADTAIKYGYVCSAVYPAVSLILNSVKFNDYSVDIAPNFDKKESEISLYAEISIIPWLGVIYLLIALIKFIKLKVKGIL